MCIRDRALTDCLFEPFVVGDEARTTRQGSGLGLAIARKICLLYTSRCV